MQNMQKYCLPILICVLSLSFTAISANAYTFAIALRGEHAVSITKDLPAEQTIDSMVVKGRLPQIINLENETLQEQLNQQIADIYNEKLQTAATAKSKSVAIDYKLKTYGDYNSVIIYFTTAAATIKDEAVSFVFKSDGDCPLGINDILGANGIKLVNKGIEDVIKQNPGKYNSDFNGLSQSQAFYVEEGMLTVIFNKYVLGPGALGLPTFSFDIGSIQNHSVAVDYSRYYLKEPYNLKMIPLRPVCEALGYEVKWNFQQRSVDIIAEDFLASIVVGINSYFSSKNSIAATLETPPEMFAGITYLPISFFDSILNAVYTAEENGDIVFSIYAKPALESSIFIE